MTKEKVADEALGRLAVKQNELFKRVKKGSVDAGYAINSMQQIIEGKFSRVGRIRDFELLIEWGKFYRSFFNVELDLENIIISTEGWESSYEQLIVVNKGITLTQIWEKCCEVFKHPVGKFDKKLLVNIDSVRTSDKSSYAVWVNDLFKKNDSIEVSKISSRNIKPITIEERLLDILMYSYETKSSLKKYHSLVCVGSKFRNHIGHYCHPGDYVYVNYLAGDLHFGAISPHDKKCVLNTMDYVYVN